MKNYILGVLACALTLLSSCKKESIDAGAFKKASFSLMLETTIGNQSIELNKTYISEKDTFSISELKYFISNITFVNTEDQTSKTLDGSYVLFDLDQGSTKNSTFEIDEVVTFDKLQLSFGVDSIANKDFYNTSGDLKPGGQDGMAWTWDNGYKFIKLEGKTNSGNFIHHIGTEVNYTTIEIPVSGTLEEDGSYELHIQADFLSLLNEHHKVDLDMTTDHGHSHSEKHPLFANSTMNFLSIHHFTGGPFNTNSSDHHHDHQMSDNHDDDTHHKMNHHTEEGH